MLNQLLFPIAKRFVSGQTIPEAIRAVRHLNSVGILTTLDVLGENVRPARQLRRLSQLTSRRWTGFNEKA